MKRIVALVPIALVLSIIVVAGCGSAEPVVKKVDHIAIMSENPQELFKTMTDTLGLPVAWEYTEYPGFQTGGVQMGNVNVELLHFGPPAQNANPEAFIYGVVFDPYPLEESVPELEKRGAEPQKPEVQTIEVDGRKLTAWTNVTLKGLASEKYTVYLCQYAPEVKARMTGGKETGPLGPLGIESMDQVIVTSEDAKSLRETWSKCLAPDKMSSEGVMEIGTGPAISVQEGAAEMLMTLVLKVESLSAAKSAIEKAGMLGSGGTSTRLVLEPRKVQGLSIEVVEK